MKNGNGYENAPSTKLLATFCAACGRPLLDAVSVETGMGPHCRKAHGTQHDLTENQRVQANHLIYQIALDQTSMDSIQAAVRLALLGFTTLADKVIKRCRTFGAVVVRQEGSMLAVQVPYREHTLAAMRAIPGRRWDRKRKVNLVPTTQKAALWRFLQDNYPGSRLVSDRGIITIGA